MSRSYFARCSRPPARNLAALAVSLIVALLAAAGTALADRGAVRHETAFKEIPGSSLEIRAVQYDGSTNGALTVQVKNKTKAPQKFAATGLYFVPEGPADSAPQRLGAVGPMQLAGASAKEQAELEVAPGATVEVVLDVFCIDSHRASPTPSNKFHVGTKRLPRELAATIERRADRAVAEERALGKAAPRPAAKAKIQDEVWRSRDAKWVELDGEGKQEARKRR